jgi:hypothetical protein
VVSAPPGSGKSVLLRSWISWAGVAGSAARVTAGRGEHHPQQFWLSVRLARLKKHMRKASRSNVRRLAVSRRF